MILANEYLEKWYPKNGNCLRENEKINYINYNSKEVMINNFGKTHQGITHLNLTRQNLTNSLDLTDFVNLTELNCSINQLTQIILPTINQLENIDFSRNKLTSFNYLILNPETLTRLRLFDNNLEETNIEVFSHLVNLIDLSIGYNQFFGSLQSLQNCQQLKILGINKSKINKGLEYLPTSLVNFHFKKALIEQQLKTYFPSKYYDCYEWKIYWGEYMIKQGKKKIIKQLITELKKCLKILKKSFSLKEGDLWWSRNHLTINVLNNPNNGFQLWVNEKISELQAENVKYYQQIEINSQS